MIRSSEARIINYSKKSFKCDVARISVVGNKKFLIIGFNKQSKGQWYKNGRPYDFDYIEEKAIASGKTWKELWKSAKQYKELNEKGWDAIFKDINNPTIAEFKEFFPTL